MTHFKLFVIVLLFLVAAPVILHADAPEELTLVRLSPQDGKAVIKTADGGLSVVRVGDRVGENSTITEITEERVMLERPTDQGMETIIIRLIEGKQSVEVLTRPGLRERRGPEGLSNRR